MTPTRATPRKFPEREIRRGWTGEASTDQPVLGDRFLSIVNGEMRISVGHAQRITRIVQDAGTTLYHLTDGTIITAPRGARITWEEA